MHQPIFISDAEAASIEKQKNNALMINVGSSPFANVAPKNPWVIDDDISGITPYGLWFGMTQLIKGLSNQYAAGIEIVEWFVQNMEDPFSAVSIKRVPERFQSYGKAFLTNEGRIKEIAARSAIYLLNGLFQVACQVSEDPRTLSAQYKALPYNRVDFSIVYNPSWGKSSIGANTLGPMPHGSSAMLIWNHLDEARKLYEQSGKVYLTVTLNLDVVTAAMLAQGYGLPIEWVRYVEALKLGNFSSRLNKRLPDLIPVGQRLSELDTTSGKWGGSPTFQGSARGERTTITDHQQILIVMAYIFPKEDGIEPILTIRRGP